MLVMDLMDRDLTPISPGDSCERALAMLEATGVECLPVLEGRRLVGLVTELDIRRRAPQQAPTNGHYLPPDDLFPHVKVAGVMSYAPATIPPRASLAEAAATMRDKGCSPLPVVDGGQLVGMLWTRSLIEALIDLLQARPQSSSPH